jgi:hypothetical protein
MFFREAATAASIALCRPSGDINSPLCDGPAAEAPLSCRSGIAVDEDALLGSDCSIGLRLSKDALKL